MNNKIMIALAALVVVAGLAIYRVNERNDDSGAMEERKGAADALAELDEDDIDALEIHVPGEAPVIVQEQSATWRITAPYDAEPDVSTVESAIEKLVDVSVRRVAATNPKNHAELEVDEAQGVRVIARGDGKVLRDIVIGSFGGGEQMVRIHGQDPVLAVDQSLRWVFNKKLKDWRNKTITEETAADATRVAFELPYGQWVFVRAADVWEQVQPKKPIEKYDPDKVKSLVTTLSRLSAVDFAEPSLAPEQAGLADGASKVTITYTPTQPKTVDAGSDANGPSAAASKEIVFLVGGEKEGNVYVKRADTDLIYLVSSFSAKKLKPTVEEFQESEEPPAQPGMAGGMPGGMPGMQGPGGQNIPPDIMKKIQAQMQAQGQQ